MPVYLRQSTASQEVTLGPFLDSTDGNTEETALTIANTDIKIHKAGATTLANKNSGGGTHISNGIYYAVLDATDTNTLGSLIIYCHPSGALATKVECVVLTANVYDSLIAGSDLLDTNASQLGGTTQTGNDVGADVDAILVDTGTTLETHLTDIKGGTFSGATDSLEAIRDRGDAAWITATGFSTHSAADVWAVATRVLTANTNLNDPTAAAIADAVWDEAIAGHLTAGTAGLYNAIAGGILLDGTITGTPTTTTFDFTGGSTSNNFYKDQLAYIISGTGIGQVRPVLSSSYSGGTTTLTFDEVFITTPAASDRFVLVSTHVHPVSTIADAVWDEAASGHVAAGSFGAQCGTDIDAILADTADMQPKLGTPSSDISADIAAVKSDTAAILTDTGTTLDTAITAIKNKTDSLTFTKANELDANVQSVNDVTITGDGSATPFNV